MTSQIRPTDTFLGWPATKLKTMLNSWERGRCDPHELSKLKSLGFTTGACAALIGECFDRGFITVGYPDDAEDELEPSGNRLILKLSDAGNAIAAASARKRASKAKAAEALDRLIANAERLARDENALKEVSEIWVFGSFIDGAKNDVGDLDVVVTTRRKEKFKGLSPHDRRAHLRQHYPDIVPRHVMFYSQESEWMKRMVFGGRRDPLVAPSEMDDLIAMHRPCRQVYDAARGGRIEAEDHPHHPDSTERANHMRDRLVMPELGGAPEGFQFVPAAVYMWPAEIAERVPAVIGERRLSPADLAHYGSRPLDGRRGVAVVANGTGRALFHIERTVDFTHDNWSYKFSIEAVHLPRGFFLGHWYLHRVTEMIGGLFNGDLLRLADRRAKLGVYPRILADIEFCERSARLYNLVDSMQNVTAEPWSDKGGETLPAAYRYAIDLSWSGEIQWGFLSPSEYDDADWEDAPISRPSYEEWACANGLQNGVQFGSGMQPPKL